MTTTDSDPPESRVTRERAAELMGCSVRTVDRRIPAGTPGRTDGSHVGPVLIDIALVRAQLPLPGGELVAEP